MLEKPTQEFPEKLRELEQTKERGKNVHLKITFGRHEEPGKTPEGMSADFLTEAGIKAAQEKGKTLKNEYILAFGSKAVKRARETAAHELETASGPEGLAKAANKRTKTDQTTPQEFFMYKSQDLDPLPNAGALFKEPMKLADEKISAGEIKKEDKYDFIIDYYLNNPDKAKQANSQTPSEVASRIAKRLITCIKMSARLFEGLDLNVRNITHGPNLECFLSQVLIQSNGQTGFNSVKEINGALKPGETIDIDLQRDENGNLQDLTLTLRGQEYKIDMEKLKELVKTDIK